MKKLVELPLIRTAPGSLTITIKCVLERRTRLSLSLDPLFHFAFVYLLSYHGGSKRCFPRLRPSTSCTPLD